MLIKMLIYKIETKRLTTIFTDKKMAISVFYQIMHHLELHKFVKVYEVERKNEKLILNIQNDDNTHINYRKLRGTNIKSEI